MIDCSRDTARAMSQENIENMRRVIDAWNRRDRDEWLAGFAPEAEWHTSGLFADEGVYRGRAGLERYWAKSTRTWRSRAFRCPTCG